MAVFFVHLNDLSIEAVSYAASEIIKHEDMKKCLPSVAMIRRYARQYKPPRPVGNLSTPALPEFTAEQHEQAAKNFNELMVKFEPWGTA